MRLKIMMAWVAAAAIGGCAHVKGVAVEDISGKPLKTAVLTVGRPDGIGVFERHTVDDHGAFDFYLSPTDVNYLYIYDGAGNPAMTMQRIESEEMSDHMKLRVRPASAGDFDNGMRGGIPPGMPR